MLLKLNLYYIHIPSRAPRLIDGLDIGIIIIILNERFVRFFLEFNERHLTCVFYFVEDQHPELEVCGVVFVCPVWPFMLISFFRFFFRGSCA